MPRDKMKICLVAVYTVSVLVLPLCLLRMCT